MQTKPFFSIIIPTLNEEHYLPLLLKCLQRQTFKRFEVLIIDANSQDQTVNKAASFSKKLPHLKLLTSKLKSPGHQRNHGAKIAKGNYLVFLDADVQVASNHLDQLHRIILKHPESVFLTSWTKPASKETFGQIISFASNLSIHLARLFGKSIVDGNNIIVNRHVFNSYGGFNPSLRAFEDFELAERLFENGVRLHVFRFPQVIQTYRRFHHGNKIKLIKTFFTAYRDYSKGKQITTPLYDYHHPPISFK